MWREVLHVINEGTVEGLTQAAVPPKHDAMFLQELRHANEVFAAFKVHAMGEEMAAKLFDQQGNLKSFDKWVNDVAGISSHQVGSWLRTEYDTAVIRAHAAADWKEFERNRDIFPNLRWMPTTSPNPEGSHRQYWQSGLTLPIDDPFWNSHHPGDRWNCKCSLEATDEPVVRPADMETTTPQKGLENNPGKDGHIFNDTHPYFPSGCGKCPFNKGFKNKMQTFFTNEKKHCMNCSKINQKIDESANSYRKDEEYGIRLLISNHADPSDLDDNIAVAKSLLSSFKKMKIKIREHVMIKDVKNPEFEIDGLIADNKKIMSEKGVASGFKKAKKQGCKVVIIDLDASMKRLNVNRLSTHIFWRNQDFEDGTIEKCFVAFNKKAILLDKSDVVEKAKIAEKLEKLKQ